jgi:hypothetical protein
MTALNYCVYSPFRVSSQTFSLTINSMCGEETCNMCSKTHNHEHLARDVDVFVLPLRNEIDIYPSAYFQDCMSRNYDYFLTDSLEELLETPLDQLIEHFMRFEWNEFYHTNYSTYLTNIEKITGVPIVTEFEGPYHVIEARKHKIVLFKFNHITDDNAICACLKTIGLNVVKPIKFGITEKTPYGELYKKFLKAINEHEPYVQKYKNCLRFY